MSALAVEERGGGNQAASGETGSLIRGESIGERR